MTDETIPTLPRNTYMGKRRDGEPENEAEHFYQCKECGGWVDKRDLSSVFDHEDGGSHPKTDLPNN